MALSFSIFDELFINFQISSLVDKLAREKEMYSNSVRSAQEKTEHLKEALDERRSAFTTLQEKYAALESSLKLSEQTNRQKQEYVDSLKTENSRKEKQHDNEIEKLKEQLALVEKTHRKAIKTEEEENTILRKKNKDITDELDKYKSRLEEVEKLMKDKEFNYHKTLTESERQYSDEINKLVKESGTRKQADQEKYQKLEQVNCRLEEEVSSLKSKVSKGLSLVLI